MKPLGAMNVAAWCCPKLGESYTSGPACLRVARGSHHVFGVLGQGRWRHSHLCGHQEASRPIHNIPQNMALLRHLAHPRAML